MSCHYAYPSIFISDLNCIVLGSLRSLFNDSVQYQNKWGDYRFMFLSKNPVSNGTPLPAPPAAMPTADKLKIQYGFGNQELKFRFNIFYEVYKANRVSQNSQNPVETYMLRLKIIDTGIRNPDRTSIDEIDHTFKIFDILSNNENDGFCPRLLYNQQKLFHDSHAFENYYDFSIDKKFMKAKHDRNNQTWEIETNIFIDVCVNQCKTAKLI